MPRPAPLYQCRAHTFEVVKHLDALLVDEGLLHARLHLVLIRRWCRLVDHLLLLVLCSARAWESKKRANEWCVCICFIERDHGFNDWVACYRGSETEMRRARSPRRVEAAVNRCCVCIVGRLAAACFLPASLLTPSSHNLKVAAYMFHFHFGGLEGFIFLRV